MLWFSNGRASQPQFIGVRLTEKGGAPVLILQYPDGSQETETFDYEDALVEGAMKLHNELLMSGWRLCPEPVRLETTREA